MSYKKLQSQTKTTGHIELNELTEFDRTDHSRNHQDLGMINELQSSSLLNSRSPTRDGDRNSDDDDLNMNPFISIHDSMEDEDILETSLEKYKHVNFEMVPNAKLKGKKLLYFTSCFSSIGVYIFGFEQGVMSIIISEKSFKDYFNNPNDLEIGTLIAVLELSALFSSLLVPYLSNKHGRKRTILLGALVFAIGGLVQASAPALWVMLLGRIVAGIGIGLLSSIVPLFQSECSPHEQRGLFGCIEFTGNILGFSSSIWIDYGCSYIKGNSAWKLPLLIQVMLGLILFFGGFALVESPRWLLATNQDNEGYRVLKMFHYDDDKYEPEKSKKEFLKIKQNIEAERSRLSKRERSFRYIITNNYKRISIGASAVLLAQFNGINLVSYYQPMIFKQIGFEGRSSFLMSGINALIYLGSTFIPYLLIDNKRIGGRRKIFIIGGLVMGISLFLAGIFDSFESKESSILVAVMVVIYMAAFGFSWGGVSWLYNAEIYSDSYTRSVGSAIGGASNWFSNFIVGEVSPELLEVIKFRLYFIYGTSCFISCGIVYLWYPETAGVELEDMDELFENYFAKKQ